MGAEAVAVVTGKGEAVEAKAMVKVMAAKATKGRAPAVAKTIGSQVDIRLQDKSSGGSNSGASNSGSARLSEPVKSLQEGTVDVSLEEEKETHPQLAEEAPEDASALEVKVKSVIRLLVTVIAVL